jgi:hypothetical protein
MDSHNLFMTKFTYRAVRLEYAAGLVTAVVLALLHFNEIRWWVFILMFVHIDLIGYIPGAIAWRKAKGGHISKRYYVLYNTMHSFLTAGALAAVWSLVAGPEWALLALAIQLCGDRALFGNFYKHLGLSFEPVIHPAYEEFVNRYEHPAEPQPVVHHARRADRAA